MSATPMIDHLHLVTLALGASSPDGAVAPGVNRKISFIYGIGTQGLCAFEQRLHGKVPGDRLTERLDSHNLPLEFEHLGPKIIKAVDLPLPMDLEIEITAVRRATDPEVVKALAQIGESGGCGGGCGDGCSC